MAEQFRRKTPEELLDSISKLHRGRLKIILGAVSGAGKTYHMLLEGHALKKKGLDVVIGVIGKGENRPKTEEKIGTLETVMPVQWRRGDTTRYDLDLEALFERNPEVVLVDNLAKRNRPGSPNPSRFDDVLDLLHHGISVVTTLNIYELSGAKQIAKKLTGVNVRLEECLPEDTLTRADEVKLLDVPPESILKRIQEGCPDNLYGELFNKGNLAALRELALRFLAGEVSEDLEDYREKQGLIGASGASERILVTAQYHWNGSILIRRGHQIAKRLGGTLNVVCFVPHNRSVSAEEASFKRSMKKLTEKLDGVFEERVLLNEEASAAIVSYAMKKNITRIVMGHSKKSVWEERVKGSVVNKILRHTRNIDIFLVPDRAEVEGERLLPARQNESGLNPFKRLTADEMADEISKIRRGTLKIYIGAAPGVGKTYTMLREANELRKEGLDIVIGLLETHGRKETQEQVGELELIPRKQIPYKNVLLEEMDTEAIITRNPEVVLVDELAHTNVPFSKHLKRFEDVEEILEAGISVISTVNIQHLESLNDSVEQITGVRVRETVPDRVMTLADEIELIDISPVALRQRMREGSIYAPEKVEQSLQNFFKTGNLIALRELALREVADDVDERLESLERSRAMRGPWRKQETIFVCINLGPESERLIRRGFRIAYRLKAKWYVMYVKGPAPFTADQEALLKKAKLLTERLGGIFLLRETKDQKKIVQHIVIQLIDKKATQLIVGHTSRSRVEELWKGRVVQNLLKETRNYDVLVVANPYEESKA
ncbi:histidine kinase [Bacillus mangrovi]|uniref:Histidine kinase n=1 Tax=Metabacillus mangrovi TaxID=1491830 RepID=A0A7X2S4A6_9BACI|nr:universal stress protein [Metabacillus mangrovi]MTH53433.1 histidine kinase [Metabacillus mangrovi]